MNSSSALPPSDSREISNRLVVFGLPIGFLACLALVPLQIDNLFGLPAHPLLLHVPVVLIPLLGVATLALMIKPDWRQRYGLVLAIAALVILAATVLTVGAGHAFQDSRETAFGGGISMPGGGSGIDHHASLGDQLRIIMFVFVGSIIALTVGEALTRDHGEESGSRRKGLLLAARILISLLAVVAVVWTVRTGHSGAEQAWQQPGGGSEMTFPQNGQMPEGFPEGGPAMPGEGIPSG